MDKQLTKTTKDIMDQITQLEHQAKEFEATRTEAQMSMNALAAQIQKLQKVKDAAAENKAKTEAAILVKTKRLQQAAVDLAKQWSAHELPGDTKENDQKTKIDLQEIHGTADLVEVSGAAKIDDEKKEDYSLGIYGGGGGGDAGGGDSVVCCSFSIRLFAIRLFATIYIYIYIFGSHSE